MVKTTSIELKGDKYFVCSKKNDDNRLTTLFYPYPQSFNGFNADFNAFTFENTFKTNLYGVPVCEIIGATGLDCTVQLGFIHIVVVKNYTAK